MALREGTYPPAPFLQGKGSKVPLMAYISSCSDGVARGHKAIKYPSHHPPAKPIRVPPFLAGRGVRGVGPAIPPCILEVRVN